MEKQRKDLVQAVLQLVETLSLEEKSQVLSSLQKEKLNVPVSIFTSNLSALQAIVVYSKDHLHKSITQISKLLNRKQTTISTTYYKAKRKLRKELPINSSGIDIPLSTFSNRNFAVLELLITYLHEVEHLSFAEISRVLNKAYSTIKTTHSRYLKKRDG